LSGVQALVDAVLDARRLVDHGERRADRRVLLAFADLKLRGHADTLRHLDIVPTPEDAPEFYVDFDETGPYVAEVAESECAT
jgi:hypothetical protein